MCDTRNFLVYIISVIDDFVAVNVSVCAITVIIIVIFVPCDHNHHQINSINREYHQNQPYHQRFIFVINYGTIIANSIVIIAVSISVSV